MASVRAKERQAEWLAHLLDDAFRLPHTGIRFGLDPMVGLIPVVGDLIATVSGAVILLIAKPLGVPTVVLIGMAYNLLLNGVFGSIPFFGDAYSFWFKSHAKNTALLIRTVAQGEQGACPIEAPPVTVGDLCVTLLLTGPIIALVGYLGFWLWERQVSILSFLY